MGIDSLKINKKELCWNKNGKSHSIRVRGNIFFAEVLCDKDCPIFVIVARSCLKEDDKFYLLDGTGRVVKEIFVPEGCPEVSSLYAVDKTTCGYDIITRSNATKSGRDIALVFDSSKLDFISWRETW